MKLPTKDRKRIRTAAGKPVEITWPQTEDAPKCKAGSKYPVYTDNGLAFRIRVVSHEGEKAVVRIDHDSVRRLPGLSGQRREDGSFEDEPERVPASYERQLALEAQWSNIGRGEAQRRVEATKTGGKAQGEAMARAERRLAEAS